ncbi:MAG: tetratricopeptide repeat protein [Lachnospiraceae bacterium]|nr:tetratricopeptide repeat protein [Lachnospiraceae bacterium]
MNKKIKRIISITFVFILLMLPVKVSASDGSSYVYDGYIYDLWGNVKESPATFQLERTINVDNMGGSKLGSVDDVCTSKDGRIFLVDSTESRIFVLDENGGLLANLKLMRNADNKIALDEAGNQIMLTAPEGVFVHEKNRELYVADTGAGRILVLDLDNYSLKRIIGRPENLTGATQFKPSKITVDLADRIYVVVQSSYEGIIELTADGSFSGYYGVNTPRVSLIDYFWKSLASDEQKAQMSKTYAPAFNNIALDGEGFVMAVTYDTSAADMVFRLNSKGENVLREEGNTLVVGEIWSLHGDDQGSRFVDIAVTDYGTYALIDRAHGRIFLYNFDGELLNVFGTVGNLKGQFKDPSGIAWLGDKLVVSDKTLKCAYIMTPTEFGRAVLDGNRFYYNGKWDEALVHFEKAVKLNVNYDAAYSGIGKNYLMKNEYKKAMEYFKLGQNRMFYSKAYNGYRSEMLEKYFPLVMVIFIALIGWMVFSEIRYHRKGGKKK